MLHTEVKVKIFIHLRVQVWGELTKMETQSTYNKDNKQQLNTTKYGMCIRRTSEKKLYSIKSLYKIYATNLEIQFIILLKFFRKNMKLSIKI